MDDSYRVEFEDEPDPRDLAFLEDHMARAAVDGCRCRRREGVRGSCTQGWSDRRRSIRRHVGRGLSASCRMGRRDTAGTAVSGER